jgi:hypothetical protein
MKQLTCAIILLMAIAMGVPAQQANNDAPVAVPDEATAVQLAEKALAKVYGKEKVDSERPFAATLSDGIWHVAGTLYCKDKHGKVIRGRCVGGVAMAYIRQSDGRVLKTGHTK